jgi:hypothetical protein
MWLNRVYTSTRRVRYAIYDRESKATATATAIVPSAARSLRSKMKEQAIAGSAAAGNIKRSVEMDILGQNEPMPMHIPHIRSASWGLSIFRASGTRFVTSTLRVACLLGTTAAAAAAATASTLACSRHRCSRPRRRGFAGDMARGRVARKQTQPVRFVGEALAAALRLRVIARPLLRARVGWMEPMGDGAERSTRVSECIVLNKAAEQ